MSLRRPLPARRIGCRTCGCAAMTAVAPAASATRANSRWRAFSRRRALDAPVERRDDDVAAARRRAHAGADRLARGERRPRAVGAAANEVGPMSEKPTKPTRRPRRLTTCGRRAAASVAPAPTGQGAAAAHGAHGVEQRVRPVVARVVVGEVQDVEARELHDLAQAVRPAAEVELLGHRRSRARRSRTRGCRRRCRARAASGRRPATATAPRARP